MQASHYLQMLAESEQQHKLQQSKKELSEPYAYTTKSFPVCQLSPALGLGL